MVGWLVGWLGMGLGWDGMIDDVWVEGFKRGGGKGDMVYSIHGVISSERAGELRKEKRGVKGAKTRMFTLSE